MVNSIYSSVRLRVRSGGVLSEAFDNHLGVKQGEPLSPLLFLFFINDIIQDISTDVNEDVISLNGILIYLILFADDTVLFGKTPTVLQHLFDKLLLYCNKWNIEVNADKTKVVVFRNGFRPVDTNFYYDNKELQVVNSYVYLGVLLHYNGKFLHTQKRLAQQGSRAMSSLMNSLKQFFITPEEQMFLFDSMVGSVLGYASEIWGFHRAKDIELIHNRFCRFVLKLGRNVPTCFLYGELGHLPLFIVRKQKILKYWLHIITNKPKVVYDVYKLLYDDAINGYVNWASNIRDILYDLGLNYVWLNQDATTICINTIKTRIKDQYLQNWSTSIQECSKLSFYCRFKLTFYIEKYLSYINNVSLLTKLRSGTLKLNIEVGRYNNISRENRLCECCKMCVIEDEYHFVLVCPAYRSVRTQFLPKYYCSWPNDRKLLNILQASSKSLMIKLCNYVKAAWNIRSNIVS
ncbi:uncharacterized protein [Mytilus edulis]|uniref:uncharacterized protein n=1 Tax=Mytilus edulis TaxID=6550 RepID=UPI0039EF7992